MDQPGFYPDPTQPGQLRYWNGLIWTGDTQPEPEHTTTDPNHPDGSPENMDDAHNQQSAEPTPEPTPELIPDRETRSESPGVTHKTIAIGVLILLTLLGGLIFLAKDTIAFAGGATRTTASASKDYTYSAPTTSNPRGRRCVLRYTYIAKREVHTGTAGCNADFNSGRIDIEYANWFPGVSRLANPPARFTWALLIELGVRAGIAGALIFGVRWIARTWNRTHRRRPTSTPGGLSEEEPPFDPRSTDALIKPPPEPT